MSVVSKIISGGQTGVDQAALRLAGAVGLKHGGWCPPGRKCEDGTIPAQFRLQETPKERSPDAPKIARSLRTEWNVRDADATLVLKPRTAVKSDSGTEWTGRCAIRYAKPLYVCDPDDPDAKEKIVRWLRALPLPAANGSQAGEGLNLNVGGPSERTAPGIGERAYDLLLDVFSAADGLNSFAAESLANGEEGSTGDTEHEPFPWWLGAILKVFRRLRLTNGPGIIVALIVAFGLLALLTLGTIFLGVQFFGLRIVAGQIYLGPAVPILGAHTTVDATAAFQNSGIKLRKGQKIVLHPEGRVHMAMDHANNLTQAIKASSSTARRTRVFQTISSGAIPSRPSTPRLPCFTGIGAAPKAKMRQAICWRIASCAVIYPGARLWPS